MAMTLRTSSRAPAIGLAAILLLVLTAPVLAQGLDAHEANRRLGRGINLGNALEAPREGDWGMTIEPDYFRKIRQAGFSSVRVPIRWSAHADQSAPFTIRPEFFERIDDVLDQALAQNLTVVINIHHFDEIHHHPDTEMPQLVALWKQIAARYRDRPDSVYFEFLNEPMDKLDDDRWNAMIPVVLETIRATNPDRTVIIGPAFWNNVGHLSKLILPDDDRHLIVTFHYYAPFEFTHQGAEWVEGSGRWLGTRWSGDKSQRQAIDHDFDVAAAWAKKHDRPIYVGEFGSYSKADDDSRTCWTQAVARAAETRSFSWSYWEFGSGFGAFDRTAGQWRAGLRDALIPGERATPPK